MSSSIDKMIDNKGKQQVPSFGQKDDEIFELYGVVVHMGGGCRSGHYYSYCKGFDNEWYLCNDESVSKCRNGIEEALKQ